MLLPLAGLWVSNRLGGDNSRVLRLAGVLYGLAPLLLWRGRKVPLSFVALCLTSFILLLLLLSLCK